MSVWWVTLTKHKDWKQEEQLTVTGCRLQLHLYYTDVRGVLIFSSNSLQEIE